MPLIRPGVLGPSCVTERMLEGLPRWQLPWHPGSWEVSWVLWGTEQMAPRSPRDTGVGIIVPRGGWCPPSEGTGRLHCSMATSELAL